MFYEGPLFSDNLTMAIRNLDFTCIFDAAEYADDECRQFLNSSLVDNPSIPFPEYGLGITLNWDITDSWYLLAGVADAQADGRETGFKTAFHKEDYFFYAVETGKTLELESEHGPMPGTYRLGFWIDDQEKERFSNSQMHRSDTGFYTSCDQMMYKENDNIEDSQGLGGFIRYGWADSQYNSITNFFCVGLQYQGLFNDRNEDVCGLGYAKGFFSDKDAVNYPQDYESVVEAYYNLHLSPLLAISPSMQYVTNPSNGEGMEISDALIIGLRLAMTF
jgi:carbohydrate-selective porin OprB